ncbi:MAG TPA: cell division protein FtsA [Methylovirgula sp.]|nr:cell division protein FtsA [Methylovirgula sp.]
MSARMLPPRMRALSARKSALLCALDIGTSKIVCLIARLNPMDSSESLHGRTHRCRVLGIGHQRSAGMKSGTVVDLDQVEAAIRRAVDAAERMAGVQVESVIVNVTGGRIGSQLYNAQVGLGGRGVVEADVHRVLEACAARTHAQGKAVLHSLPTGFSLGDTRNIRDPKGMIADALGADMHVVSCDATAARNLMLAVERCHLAVEAMVATPYAAGLSALVDDEAELGTTLIDMGGGTTSIGVFAGGSLVHVDALALGGNHITLDIARGLNTRLADAERLKTLYGACLASVSDERETIAVTLAGEDGDHPTHVPKSQLVRIIRPRVEEILELVRDRLKSAGLAANSASRFILTGGASQLTGMTEAAKHILAGQIRVGRPLGIHGLPESAKNPSFSAAVGLLVYPQAARIEYFRPGRRMAEAATGTGGYIARVGQWLRESF